MSLEKLGHGQPVLPNCRCVRKCSVSRPKSVRNDPNGLWHAPVSRSQVRADVKDIGDVADGP